MPDRILNLAKKLFHKNKKQVVADTVDENLQYGVIKEYENILIQALPYYNELTAAEKDRFLKRLHRFHRSKKFHFTGMEELKEAPVLISAAAIQITFGLKRFMLPYFKEIFIVSDAYHLKGAGELYIGHVSPKGIYISWRHLKEGFAVPDDGLNVVYHELAHAVHHESFIEETGVDWDFREDFEKLSHLYGPALSQVITERKSYLRGYAFTNFHEFWAVTVESFFENAKGLSENMPGLYGILREMLNQDPLQTPKVLSASNEKPS